MNEPKPMTLQELTEGHTFKRYDGELSHLHYLVLEMGALVLTQAQDALAAFKNRDVALARKVVGRDEEVDRLEIRADDEVFKLIARRCPLGSDLRLVMAVSKSVSDLERIGDEAVRIAGLVNQLFGSDTNDPGGHIVRDVNVMGEMALCSLQNAVGILDDWSAEKAQQVIATHREMDEEFQSDLRRLMTFIMEDARNIGIAISLVLVIKSLERIGHHAQNLAEYAIFMVQGQDIRTPPAATGKTSGS